MCCWIFCLLILHFGRFLTFHHWFSFISRCLTMTRTSVMSVTVSPWIPTATREAVRDTTLVYNTVASCVCVLEYNRGKYGDLILSYTAAFYIIMQIGFKGHKHSFFSFWIKLMDGIASQGYLDDWNQSQTPVIISLPGEPNQRKTT